ncbi:MULTISPECIES: hypothetical protein [unclassified Blastococcus]
MSSTPAEQPSGRKHAAGAFDVRNVIAALIGFYGVVLVIVGLFGETASDREKTGGVNANLWAGLAMVVVALAFFLWTRWRPAVVEPPHAPGEGVDDGTGATTGPPRH